jgi:preprotein translocase subunit SecE
VAKQTRAQRRARRAEQQRQANGADLSVQRSGGQMRAAAAPTAAERQLPGGGFKRFVGESWAELKKVEWPRQPQLIQGTTVVLIACAIVGAYLWLSDLAFKRLVENVFLGQ